MKNIFILMPKLFMLIVVIFIALYIVRKLIRNLTKDYEEKNNKGIIIKIGVIILCSFLFINGINSLNKNRLPSGNKVADEFIIKLNQIKESKSGTKVRLNNVLMDINIIEFDFEVKGKDKVVAVEIKKSPEDEKAIREMTGLYVGEQTMYSFSGLGMSMDGDEVLEILYVVFYLTNGEEVIFKVEDVNKVKDHVKVININKKLKDEPQIILNKVIKGVSHTSISVTSDINFFDLQVSIIDGQEEYKELTGGGSGGIFGYSGPPVKTKDIKVKFKIKGIEEEYIVPVEF